MPSTDNSLEPVRKLFPDLPEKELEEVKEFLDEYLSIMWRIYERLERENPKILDKLIEQKRKEKKQRNQSI